MQRILLLLIVFNIFIGACASRTVRQSDLDAWVGVELIELETHPIFSAMPLEKRQLSDGSIMLNYSNSSRLQTDMECKKGYLGSTKCSGGDTVDVSCINQFLVKNGTVIEYRPLGNCYTDCRARPKSKTCTE